MTPLILHSRERAKDDTEGNLDVWIFEHYTKIVVCKEGKVLLANCVSSDKSNDIVYFILYTLKQLGLSPKLSTEVYGNNTTAQTSVETLKKYLSHLNWHGDRSSQSLSRILSSCAS